MNGEISIQTFVNDSLGKIRTAEIDGIIYFVAVDIATILGKALGVLPSFLLGIDPWKTLDEVPMDIIGKEIDTSWNEDDAIEKLISALGLVFRVEPEEYRGVYDSGKNDYLEHVYYDGVEVCTCSWKEKVSLFEEISSCARHEVKRFLRKKGVYYD